MNRDYRYTFTFLIFLLFTELYSQSADIDTSYWNIDLDDVVVTAQYAPTSAKKAIHEVKVLESEELKARGYSTIDEALRNQLNMRINADPILGNSLEIQGIGGQHIKVMIDGVPVIGRLNGNIDLSQVQLNNVDRIEIVEGALSTNYGSNASGGVVNIITKKSIEKSVAIDVETQYESVGVWKNQLNIAGSYKGLTARIGANLYNSQVAPVDSLRQYKEVTLPNGNKQQIRKIPWNPKEQIGANAALFYRFSDSLKLSYNYRFFDEEVQRYGKIRRPEFQPYAFNEKFSTGRQDHSLQLESYLDDHWYLKSISAYNEYNRHSEKIREDFKADTLHSLPEERDTSIFYSVLHRTLLSYNTEKGYSGLVGLEYQHEGGIGERIVDSTSAQPNESTLSNLALWLSLRYSMIKNVNAQASLRYGYNSGFDHPLLPSVHVEWDFFPSWSVKLSYAHGYRAPALKELHSRFIDVNHYIIGNPDLEAEKSRNASFILSYEREFASDNKLELEGKAFYNKIENSIILAEYEQLKYTYQNISEFETHGFNATAVYSWRDRLELKMGVGYTRSLNVYTEKNENTFINQIELQNSASYNMTVIDLTFYATHKFVGNQHYFYLDGEENLQQASIGSYNYIDVSAQYAFWREQISITAGVKNVLDVTSVPITAGAQSTHSPFSSQRPINWGRSYFIKLGLSLDY